METKAKQFAAVKVWNRDLNQVAVHEFFYSIKEAQAWISKQEKDKGQFLPQTFEWEIHTFR